MSTSISQMGNYPEYLVGKKDTRHLHTFFLDSARRYPTAHALSIGKKEWTYAEIENTARQWANALHVAGQGQIKRVGIFAYRSYISYVGILTTLFAGATCVPLNRTFPVQRTQDMITMAQLDAVIVDEQSLPQLKTLLPALPRTTLILLPEQEATFELRTLARVLDCRSLEMLPPLAELPTVDVNSIAYLLFTSGSTGRPKGVPITHSNVVSFLNWNLQHYQFTLADRFTQTFDQTFDLSFFDLFMAWGSGACLCVPLSIQLLAPFQFVQQQRITIWFSVPSIISLLLKKRLLTDASLPSLRWSLFCGEALPQSAAEAWQRAAPGSVIENLYGPTELTIACAAYRWNPCRSPSECVNGLVPIGQIYDHLDHLVVDEQLNPVPAGIAGELCVSGPQTFPGYWQDPDKTAERFFIYGERQQCYYRTGDLVKWQDTGYIYLGRADQQIKVQGYRIELGELEALLRHQKQVVDAAAIGWPVEDGKVQGIVVFVTGMDLQAEQLLQHVKEHVPLYMVPKEIRILETMPHNVNGKIDRPALLQLLNDEQRKP